MRKGLWIPQEILDLSNIDTDQKIILAKVFELEKNQRKFYFGNKSLSELINRHSDTVSIKISDLKNKGLLTEDGFDGRKRFLRLGQNSPIQGLEKIQGSNGNSPIEGSKGNEKHKDYFNKKRFSNS